MRAAWQLVFSQRGMEVVYDDNHIVVVDKSCGELVQGDRTGDEPIVEKLKKWLKVKYNKPGNVFCGVVHRIDRPTSGLVVFAKTSKGLSRMNELLRRGEMHKTYWAVVRNRPPQPAATLVHYLMPVEKGNHTVVTTPGHRGAVRAELNYRVIASSDNYHLLEVELLTGRKHQIRAQLASIGCPIKGDLKYGAPRSNPGGGISLQAHRLQFIHPVSGKNIDITAPVPREPLWQALAAQVK